jgi:hypothetical protein
VRLPQDVRRCPRHLDRPDTDQGPEPRSSAASSIGVGGGGHSERPRRLHARRSSIRGRRNRQVRPSRCAGELALSGEAIDGRHRHAHEIGDLAGSHHIPSTQPHPHRTTRWGVRRVNPSGGRSRLPYPARSAGRTDVSMTSAGHLGKMSADIFGHLRQSPRK